ncbi:hypothetical protein TEA_017367 [Camellia sinensis var. sinensis]|uniref:Protein kinase domain-containing protein n=1 Tax=Camellia sinensis var. sinensis TaxID=542762 RepID=A0A4S4E3U8_CAMSN|nr:hypothetical protein TEA_017367 [Camellia sinensis var. sinensis]
MGSANASSDLSSEMEVDAFRCLFPLCFYERPLLESMRPNVEALGKARDTTLALGAVASADGSAFAKIGCTDVHGDMELDFDIDNPNNSKIETTKAEAKAIARGLQIDVYSSGIVMWELLTGDKSYTDMHCASIIDGHHGELDRFGESHPEGLYCSRRETTVVAIERVFFRVLTR